MIEMLKKNWLNEKGAMSSVCFASFGYGTLRVLPVNRCNSKACVAGIGLKWWISKVFGGTILINKKTPERRFTIS
ncbi:hypothetical protein [Candidatus Kuenenia stuttgartiensis]|uniref:hypothetical protein n=1 Tax=Kuenenia stuttgartiensis TaxID=174633 RepID=UPI001469E663|nr:hypothetical protein [Candidatus Kuenenia stuttgartiensis]